ncbi:MAG TPA: sulfurtransferase [Bacteroidota bacterium]|nr:sulfurtransferase [Bacteroidota bacterium]
MSTNGFAHPEVLVNTEWTELHRNDSGIRVVEIDVDTKAYDEGHIPGAVGWNWQTQLADQTRRDLISKAELEKLLGDSGIDNATTVLLYGDNNNWFAAWAFWQLKVYGHKDVRIIDGGRRKWIAEGKPLTTDPPEITKTKYHASDPDFSLRAFADDVSSLIGKRDTWSLVDVRSNDEYTGKILAPAGLPETCQRGGHVPGAANIPWGKNVNEDGTFKPAKELEELYKSQGVTPDKRVVAYCRIGERSSLTWFVLKYLLGFRDVRNYDGSWTEWGNLVNVPVHKGATP